MFLMRKLNNPPPTVVKLCSTEVVGKRCHFMDFSADHSILESMVDISLHKNGKALCFQLHINKHNAPFSVIDNNHLSSMSNA